MYVPDIVLAKSFNDRLATEEDWGVDEESATLLLFTVVEVEQRFTIP